MSKSFKVYTKVVKKNRKTYSVELPDGTIKRIPVAVFSEWSLEEKQKKTFSSIKKKPKDSKKKKESNTLDNNESVIKTSFEFPYNIKKTIVGIDPSYTRTGIVVLTSDKRLIFHTLSEHIGKKDFIHTYNSAYSLAIQLKEYLSQFEPYEVVMEYAPPVSSMSPALYCLDALYHFVLHDKIKHLYHPMTLATIIGKRDRTKADSVLRGLSIIEDLKKQGYVVNQKRKPCHDCMEALIYIDYYLKSGS